MPLGWGATFREPRVLSKMAAGWGTTFWELRVLTEMRSFFVNHATGVGDHLPRP